MEPRLPTKLIPFSESELSELHDWRLPLLRFVSFAGAATWCCSPRPPDLLYAPNHFWLAAEESGLCHIGIDAFLADVVAKH